MKLKLLDLKKNIQKRSALIGIPNMWSLLSINDSFTDDEIFLEIVQNSVRTFDQAVPLVRIIKVYLSFNNTYNRYEFTDNSASYINGIIDDTMIIMIPSSIVGITRTLLGNWIPNTYVRTFIYDKPYLYRTGLMEGVWMVKGIFDHPLHPNLSQDNRFTDNSMILYMYNYGPEFKNFQDQVLHDTLRYIIDMNNNLKLPDLPVQLFEAAEQQADKLKESLDRYYYEAKQNGSLYV